jgi:uncharacterized protein
VNLYYKTKPKKKIKMNDNTNQVENETPAKIFINANELLVNSFQLADKIINSNFHPNFIIGIWRGGAPIGIAIQEYFKRLKFKTDHISIRTSSYIGQTQQKEIRVHGLEYIIEKANSTDSLLLVDDIFDSGKSIKCVLNRLKEKMRNNLPHDIRIATVYYKPLNNKTDIIPNYYLKETTGWVIFPHELEDLTIEEIRREHGDNVADMIDKQLLKVERN